MLLRISRETAREDFASIPASQIPLDLFEEGTREGAQEDFASISF
jgi:hypothetical protein